MVLVDSGVKSSYIKQSTPRQHTSQPTQVMDLGTHVEVIPNYQHWRITARALAFHLDNSELAVLGRLAWLDASQVLTYGVQDVVRAPEHARGGGADLDEVLTDWFSVHDELDPRHRP